MGPVLVRSWTRRSNTTIPVKKEKIIVSGSKATISVTKELTLELLLRIVHVPCNKAIEKINRYQYI
jgi:hypothetical protein